jgi:hypothetical protein
MSNFKVVITCPSILTREKVESRLNEICQEDSDEEDSDDEKVEEEKYKLDFGYSGAIKSKKNKLYFTTPESRDDDENVETVQKWIKAEFPECKVKIVITIHHYSENYFDS